MSTFDIRDKVVLITGGAQGLGLEYAKKLLQGDVRGITLADIDEGAGTAAVLSLEEKYGKGKVIFVACDVTDKEQYENAFKETVATFKNIDILINNAGILQDKIWEQEIAINVNGTIHGILLGLEDYIQKHKSGTEGLIVNISSVAGIYPFSAIPIYCATKFAVHGMTLSWGTSMHYQRTKVRVVAVCPGATDTSLMRNLLGTTLGGAYEAQAEEELPNIVLQVPEHMADAMIAVIREAPNGTIWVVESGSKPFIYKIPDYTTMERKYLKE